MNKYAKLTCPTCGKHTYIVFPTEALNYLLDEGETGVECPYCGANRIINKKNVTFEDAIQF